MQEDQQAREEGAEAVEVKINGGEWLKGELLLSSDNRRSLLVRLLDGGCPAPFTMLGNHQVLALLGGEPSGSGGHYTDINLWHKVEVRW